MYFPYLRGKQFELIALRELCDLFPEEIKKTSPVIEPVKNSSTLKSTLKELSDRNINFNIIINPRFGDLISKNKEIAEIISSVIPGYNNYQLAIIVDSDTERNISALVDFIRDLKLDHKGISLIHNSEIESKNIDLLKSGLDITYNLIYFSKTSRRYYRAFEQKTRVSLDDYFRELSKNADYLDQESVFSEEYKYYEEDGFVGFSDFLTIGDSYSESGFLPRAIAIHISYIDSRGRIMVKHFVSDSNEDVSDIGGKFSEAIRKLVEWSIQTKFETEAIKTFKDLENRGHFPGLGTLKKLSIMNHIELIIKNI